MASRTRGAFISLEGTEGCGKSTQAERLRSWLEARGIGVVLTREPGGTPTGEAIRGILQHHASGEEIAVPTEVLLFAASRAQHVAHVIRPALAAGKWVVCDRFVDSSLAYQAYGRDLSVSLLLEINGYAVDGVWPDRTLLFDLSVERAMERLIARGAAPDRFESEEIDFHHRVRDGYLRLAQRFASRYVVVDADREIDAVHGNVIEGLASLFHEHGVMGA